MKKYNKSIASEIINTELSCAKERIEVNKEYARHLKQNKETMNKYKIRNFPGVKIESVGKVLTEDEVIDAFGNKHAEIPKSLIPILIQTKMIDEVDTTDFGVKNPLKGFSEAIKGLQEELDNIKQSQNNKEIQEFRIKEEYRRLVHEHHMDFIFYKENKESMYIGWYYYLIEDSKHFVIYLDDAFEKVEERIKLLLYHTNGMDYIHREDAGTITEQQLILCEKVLNGDMVEKPQKLDGDFKIINNTDHELFVNQKSNEILVGKKEPVSDGHRLEDTTVEQWDKMLESVDETYTKSQVIELVKEWVTSNRICSFEKFINSK